MTVRHCTFLPSNELKTLVEVMVFCRACKENMITTYVWGQLTAAALFMLLRSELNLLVASKAFLIACGGLGGDIATPLKVHCLTLPLSHALSFVFFQPMQTSLQYNEDCLIKGSPYSDKL